MGSHSPPNNNKTHRQQAPQFSEKTEPLWTVEEVASYLRLKPETIRMMARRGEVPAIKIGRVWRFRARDIKARLASFS